MKAHTYLNYANRNFGVSFLEKNPTSPYLLSAFYSQPFSTNMLCAEMKPVDLENSNFVSDYNDWVQKQEKVLFKHFSFYRENIYELDLGAQQMYFFTFRPDKVLIQRVEFGIVEIPFPQILDDFIRDCLRHNIQLEWQDDIATKHFK